MIRMRHRFETRSASRKLLRHVSGFLCALALLLTAFAHQPVVAQGIDGVDLSAYRLPDGSLPIICYNGPGDKEGGSQMNGPHCPFCTLAKSIVLPARPEWFSNPIRSFAKLVFAPEQTSAGFRHFVGHWSRGPPSS